MVATQRLPERASERGPDPSLRRAAILLSNLDADNRRRLLAHLPPQDAARVRAAAAALSDVDPLEVRRTVSAFVGRISAAQPQTHPASPHPASPHPASWASESGSPGDRDSAATGLDPTTASHPASSGGSSLERPAAGGGLKFLNDVSDTTLLRAIGSEHPQTIAVVLASIDPRQAARLLQQLAPQSRAEAIRRLSRLEEVPQDVIDDIGRHLRGLIGTVDQVGSGEGHRLLTSIFSALGTEEREALGAGLAATDGGIAAAMAEAERVQPRVSESARVPQSTRADREASAQNLRDPNRQEDSTREDGPTDSEPNRAEQGREPQNHQESRQESRREGDDESAPHILPLDGPHSRAPLALPGIAAADAILESLAAVRLREVLAELTGREALLTLCGLKPRTVRRLLRMMPRRGAKDVRQRLNSLGPLDLSEIDRAKQKAAAVAIGSPQSTATEAATAAETNTATGATATTAAARAA